MSATRTLVALMLLVPIVAEAAIRTMPLESWPLLAVPYALAVVGFALLAPRFQAPAESVVGGAARPRAWWPVGIAFGLVGVGAYLAYRDPRQVVLEPLWLAGIAAWCFAWVSNLRRCGLTRHEGLALLALVGLAAGLRFYALDANPLQPDEVFRTEYIQRRIAANFLGVDGIFLFAATPDNVSSQLGLGVYPRVLAYRLFGVDIWSLRLVSALGGVLEVALTFVVGWVMFNRRVGFVAAATLATLAVHLAFSRYGLDTMDGSLVWTALAIPLAYGFARRSVPAMAIAGVVLALSLQVYLSARVAPAFVMAALAMAAFDPRLRGRWLALGALALLGGVLVGMGPMLAVYYRYPGLLATHSEYASWLPETLGVFWSSRDVAALRPLWDHFISAALSYNLIPPSDYNYRPQRALFMLLPAALLLSALAITCLRLGDWRHRFMALWFWAATLALSALSPFPPTIHRALPVLAICAVMIGYAFDRIVASWEQIGGAAKRIALPIMGVAIAGFMVAEAAFYHGDYVTAELSPWENAFARYVLATEPGRHIVILPGRYVVRLTTFFATDLARRNSYDILSQPSAQLPDTRERPNGISYLIYGDRAEVLPLLRELYPKGREKPLRSVDPRILQPGYPLEVRDSLMWTAYEVDADELAQYRGLSMTVTDAAGQQAQLTTPSLATPAELPSGLTYPLGLEWRGWLQRDLIDRGADAFVSTGSVTPNVRLGDLSITPSTEPTAPAKVTLPALGMPIVATAQLSGPGDNVSVVWDGARRRDASEYQETVTARPARRQGEFRAFPIGQVSTWPLRPRVRVESLDPTGAVTRTDYATLVADYGLPISPQNPTIRFTGELQVDRAGSYELELVRDGPGRLIVDGRQLLPVVPAPAGGDPSRTSLWLNAGRHAVVVERSREGGVVELSWRPPGASRRIVITPQSFVPLPWP